MNLSAFSIERMNDALEEFDIDQLDDDGQQVHGHGEVAHESSHDDVSHEHGHVSEHGHADEGGQAVACDDPDDPSHAHDHMEVQATKKKKKHDLSGVGSLGLTADRPLLSHQFNKFMSELLRLRA